MKKPVNKFAVALWVVAVVILVSGVSELVSLHEAVRDFARQGGTVFEVVGSSWKIAISSLLPAAQLAGFGVLIELVDQIRWNALHK